MTAVSEDVTYWRAQLAGAEPLELPTDRRRPLVRTGAGDALPVAVPAAVTTALRELADQHGTAPSTVALGAYVVVLSRWSRQDDVCVGVGSTVLRADLTGDPSFAELVGRLADAAREAAEHGVIPGNELPDCRAGFGTADFPPGTDLALTVADDGHGGLTGEARFATDVFDAATIERFTGHYLRTLASACADPGQRIGRIDLLSAAERTLLRTGFNATALPLPAQPTLTEQFAASVERTPDAVALASDDMSLTYRELDAKANQLARRLRADGVVTGDLVAVCLERGADLIVALFGVLKAGGVYLPLDPEYPARRLEFMLTDAKATLVITDSAVDQPLRHLDVPRLLLDRERQAIAALADDDLPRHAAPGDLAYLIYTSGSTGEPKGVMVEHRSAVNFVRLVPHELRIGPQSRVLQFTSPSFDVSMAEIFGALLAGATLVLASRRALAPGEPLADTVRRQRVSVLIISPSLLSTLSVSQLTGVRTLVAGGEACPPEVVATWLPGRTMINAYGPTETTIGATFHHFGTDDERVLLGRPVANTQAFVVDRHGDLAPIGVPGELWLGGLGVARGYWARPELTAQRFVPNPFGEGRVYRSGDLVRWLPGGQLEFLGRIDQQVKVRGLRIELGEIETVLTAHRDVGTAVVIVREDEPGAKRLVAYCVPADGHDLAVSGLREWCRHSLPDYMVPGAFVRLPALPLTPNGKLDRRALPAPAVSGTDYLAPRDDVEATVAEIWADVLGVERIGVHDNFFALGAHSLLATRVASRIAKVMAIDVSVHDLFSAPTVAELAAVLGLAGQATRPLAPRQRPERVPMSSAQRRLWFLDQLETSSVEYVVVCGFRVRGDLDRTALAAAFRGLVARHEVLRTAFVAGPDGEALQVVGEPWPIEVHAITVPGEDGVRALVAAESARPFDLASGRLLRVTLAERGDGESALVIAMHHVVTDGWSMQVLGRELRAFYAAAVAGVPSVLPALPVQYADFALWQAESLAGPALDQQLVYWRDQLAGLRPVELPTDRPRPPQRSAAGDVVRFRVEADLVGPLRELATEHGGSLFMVGLAAFLVVLSRWSGQDDVSAGTPIAARNQVEIEELIGFFVNTLVMRADLSDNPTFAELLDRVKRTALDAYAHQDLPFERLVAELAPDRQLGRNPLFQTVFAFQNAVGADWGLPGLSVTPIPIDTVTSKFDLALFMSERDGGLDGEVVFATELFDADTVERFAGHVVVALRGMVADIRQRVGEVDLLTPVEHDQVLGWSTGTAVPFADDRTVAELVAARAAEKLDAPAVVYGDTTLTYGELAGAANRLAWLLRERGIGVGDLVGVQLARGADLVVTLLGVLTAGAAYVPLDPDYPPSRLGFMRADSRAALVITGDWLAAESTAIRSFPDTAPPVTAGPRDLAYVMYTSGSTGTPKGVMVEHRSICRLVDHNWFAELDQTDVVAQAASFSFDAFTFECWAALTAGASMVVLDKETVLDPQALASAVTRHGITTMWLTASLFRQHAQDRPDLFAGLRTVLFGGEAIDRAAPDALLAGPFAPGRLVNGYGPTETTTFAACHVVGDDDAGLPALPIGRPIANTETFVVNAHGAPAPVGVPGELWIGGPGVARGYWNQPELTGERFVRNPFGPGRLYRTGDLVRWLPNGRLDFLGRLDEQVKLRGMRIEPSEIEAALRTHPAVDTAAVLLREDSPGLRQLVAYCQPEGEVTIDELREWCHRSLPDYLMPGAFVLIEAFPLTPNGKLDRDALPAPDRQSSESTLVEPRTELESVIAAVWADVLGVDRVGVHDNFFALGGHSLLATRVVNRIERITGAQVSLKQLFLAPTVAGLAESAVAAPGTGVRLHRRGTDDPVPLSFAQRRLWFLDRLEPGSAEYVVPSAFRLVGAADVQALESAFGAVVTRHEVLRTRFVSGTDGEPVQVIGDPWPVRVREVDLRAEPERARDLLDEEALRPFDLATGKLLRVMLIRTGDDESLLLVSMHHIVTDGWSMDVFGRELQAAYQGQELPDLAIQYGDFAAWQHEWLTGTVLERQVAYWRERLAGAEPLALPTDRPRPKVRSSAGHTVRFAIPAGLNADLRAVVARHGTSLFMIGAAALLVVLSRWSGQEDICVGTPIAGRNRHETEDLIGFFVNTLVLRANVSSDLTFGDFLDQVKSVALDAYAHQDLPFERLVEELSPERDLSRNPLFQVEFAVHEAAGHNWELPGTRMAPLDITPVPAKFDLSLALREEPSGELSGEAVFATELFDEATIARLTEHYVAVLAAATTNPAQPLSAIDLVTPAERAELLGELKGTATSSPARPLVAQAVHAQAARTPDAIAVVCGDTELTYRELDTSASQLAWHLRASQAGPLVAICLPRGVDLVVALLGVLRAGLAYVPLDPHHPAQRREFLLTDTGHPTVITQTSLRAEFPGIRTVLLDADRPVIAALPETPPEPGPQPDDLAYVLHTSGSTGTPKGVMIEHDALSSRCHEMRDRYGLTERDRVLQFASITFDAAAEQIYPTLMSGAALVLREDEDWTPSRIVRRIDEAAITVAELTPALWEQVIPHAADGLGERFRLLILGGDRVSPAAVADWFTQNQVPIYNTYGPTEATITATAVRITEPRDPISIGRPIADTEVFLLDRHGRLVPRGVPGELCIGGAGVARGYWNRPELTADRFVPSPFGPGRLYRTGDVARWLPSGELEFLGRLDRQVKLRGLRIELGEIESVLGARGGVVSAAVIVREDKPGDRRLVAYCVLDAEISGDELREWCLRALPAYMVPSAFVVLPALPMTTSGKIDRRALPAPATHGVDTDAYVGPRTPIETVVAEVWAEVLGVDRVGVRDNFFTLGGHSLLATRVVNRIEQLTGLDIGLKGFFLSPTVEALARQVVDVFERAEGGVA